MVVAEHQDVRKLNGRVTADSLTRRNALRDGALGRADGAGGASGIVISVQIDHADQSLAHSAVFQRALDIDIAVRIDGEHVLVHIFFHRGIDLSRVRSFLFSAKLGLGQDQIDGRNRALCVFADSIPVCRVGGKLVAGNDCPLLHMVCFGHQDISG